MAALDRMLAEAEARHARLEAQRQEERLAAQTAQPVSPPVDPRVWITTVAEARQMVEQDLHRSWFHAAYADVAQRLTKMDERLDDLEATLSLLHVTTGATASPVMARLGIYKD